MQCGRWRIPSKRLPCRRCCDGFGGLTQAARGDFSNPKEALARNPLEAMLATCTDGLIGISDRALLLFAWASGGRRRSAVTGAVMEQLTRVDAAPYLYRLGHSKTDQLGAGRQNVPLAEAMALTGHRSVATALRYFQTGAVEKSRAGNLLNAVAGDKK